jgi:hypothetical protein
MRFMLVIIGAAFLLANASVMLGQAQTGAPQPPAPNAPLELPDFLVTGKAVVDIAAGVKQTPQKPARFAANDLDSLNPTEKFPSPTVPNRSLPRFSRARTVTSSFIDVAFGTYTTPALDAGTTFKADAYRVDLQADALYTKDWQPKARLLDIGASVGSSYVAPEKFYIFGKGLTETDVSARHRSYSLFALPDAPERRTTRIFAGVQTEATVAEQPVTASLYWNLHSLADGSADALHDQRIHGDASARLGKRYDAEIQVDVQSRAQQAYPFLQASVGRTFGDSAVRFDAMLGGQYATSTAGLVRIGLVAEVSFDHQISELFTYGGSLYSGLRNAGFSKLLSDNPYLNGTTLVDVPYDIINVGLSGKYHPSQRLQVSVHVGFRQTTRSPIWTDTLAGRFDVLYKDITAVTFQAEMQYQPSLRDQILLVSTAQSAVMSDDKAAPYVEPFRLDAVYRRYWSADISTNVGLQYVGRRWTDASNSLELDGFLNLYAQLRYAVGRGMDVVVNADNLVNSTIILWNGYRERGIFVSAGVSWRM